jgi:hypothetical protein
MRFYPTFEALMDDEMRRFEAEVAALSQPMEAQPMNAPARTPYIAEIEIGKQLVELIRAQITPDDPHWDDIIATEVDVVDRMKRLLRAAREKEAMAETLKRMEGEMHERRTRFEEAAETMRKQVTWGMSELGLKRIEAPDFTASLSAGKPKVKVLNEALLPEHLCRITRTPNLTAIREFLEAGPLTLDGAVLSNPAPVLRILVR